MHLTQILVRSAFRTQNTENKDSKENREASRITDSPRIRLDSVQVLWVTLKPHGGHAGSLRVKLLIITGSHLYTDDDVHVKIIDDAESIEGRLGGLKDLNHMMNYNKDKEYNPTFAPSYFYFDYNSDALSRRQTSKSL